MQGHQLTNILGIDDNANRNGQKAAILPKRDLATCDFPIIALTAMARKKDEKKSPCSGVRRVYRQTVARPCTASDTLFIRHAVPVWGRANLLEQL